MNKACNFNLGVLNTIQHFIITWHVQFVTASSWEKEGTITLKWRALLAIWNTYIRMTCSYSRYINLGIETPYRSTIFFWILSGENIMLVKSESQIFITFNSPWISIFIVASAIWYEHLSIIACPVHMHETLEHGLIMTCWIITT